MPMELSMNELQKSVEILSSLAQGRSWHERFEGGYIQVETSSPFTMRVYRQDHLPNSATTKDMSRLGAMALAVLAHEKPICEAGADPQGKGGRDA